MTIGRLAALATLCFALVLAGCGAGSGRSGTNLVVNGVGPSAPLNGGDLAVFVMTVVNEGDFAASNVTIRNVVSQLSQSSLAISCTANGGAVCPAQTGDTMTVSSLPPGGSLVFQISATSNLGASGNVSETMSVSSDTTEIDASNNTVTVSAPVASNDVSVTATAPLGPLVDGPATFTMVVANAGPNDARNVVLTTTVSATVSFVPSAITCVPNANTGSVSSPVAAVPTLQADGSLISTLIPATGGLTCTVPVTVTAGVNGFAIVTMAATTLGDAHANNNVGTATVSATLVNDLSVTVTAPLGPLVNGAATFTAVIGNAGPSTATAVVITNTLSANLTLAGPINCVPSGGAVAPTLQGDGTLLAPSIPLNGVLTCSVPATVTAGTNGLVSDTMSLSTTDDPRTGNNTAQAAVSATLINNVSVTADPAAATVPGGGTTTFTMVVGNGGPGTAVDVALSNTLSANLTLTGPITCAASNGAVAPSPTSNGGLVSPSIPLGGLLTCSVPVVVTAGANGTVATTFTAIAANDQFSVNNTATASTVATSADLGVSQTAPTTVAAGSPTTFAAVIANPRGQGPANNLVIQWTNSIPSTAPNVTFDPLLVTCVPTGGATCPTILGPTMTLPSLLTGASLRFGFVANTTASDRGGIVNTVSVTSDGDPNLSNNSATTTTTAVDARNATYTAFAADGNAYNFTIDFDAGTYIMSGNGTTVTRNFTLDVPSGDYVVSGNVRFRYATTGDLIVGGHDFSSGVLPFVAARNFVTSVAQIAGSYDLATRNVLNGVATTHAGTALISGNTLSVCQSDIAQVAAVANCDAASRKDYPNLSVNGNVFTGFSGIEAYSFVVANTGAARVLLSAGSAPDTSQQLRIGLIDSQGGLAFGALRGPSITPSLAPTVPDWLAIALTNATPPTYSAVSAIGSTTFDSANLARINAGGPFSMLFGTSVTYSAGIYVMQASPLAIVIGSSGFGGGAASGLLQIGLP